MSFSLMRNNAFMLKRSLYNSVRTSKLTVSSLQPSIISFNLYQQWRSLFFTRTPQLTCLTHSLQSFYSVCSIPHYRKRLKGGEDFYYLNNK